MKDFWIIVLPIVGLLLVVYGVIMAFVLRSWRLQSGGLGLFERRRMRRVGKPARATVIDLVIDTQALTSIAIDLCRVVLEVCGEGQASGERVKLVLRWNWEKWNRMAVGRELPVLVSPEFPGRIMFDYPALRRELRNARQERRMADEERQRALLDDARRDR